LNGVCNIFGITVDRLQEIEKDEDGKEIADSLRREFGSLSDKEGDEMRVSSLSAAW